MSTIFLTDTCRLKTYSATTKGSKSVVRIEVEVADHSDLGFLLRELDDIDREQSARKKRGDPPKAKAAKPLVLPAPLLQLTHQGGDDA